MFNSNRKNWAATLIELNSVDQTADMMIGMIYHTENITIFS